MNVPFNRHFGIIERGVEGAVSSGKGLDLQDEKMALLFLGETHQNGGQLETVIKIMKNTFAMQPSVPFTPKLPSDVVTSASSTTAIPGVYSHARK